MASAPRPPRIDEAQARHALVQTGRRLYVRGYIAGGDGNLSLRIGVRTVLTTPTGAHKGYLRPGDLVKTDLGGRTLGRGRPSSELGLHLAVYDLRPDVGAAIHAHPVHAVALSLVGASLDDWILPETVLTLGSVPTTSYATPGTEELPESVRPALARSNAVILARHGSLTVGATLDEAFCRLENLEHTARIVAAARAIGPVQPIPPAQRTRLASIAAQLGLVPLASRVQEPNRRPEEPSPPTADAAAGDTDALVERLAQKVLARLGSA